MTPGTVIGLPGRTGTTHDKGACVDQACHICHPLPHLSDNGCCGPLILLGLAGLAVFLFFLLMPLASHYLGLWQRKVDCYYAETAEERARKDCPSTTSSPYPSPANSR